MTTIERDAVLPGARLGAKAARETPDLCPHLHKTDTGAIVYPDRGPAHLRHPRARA
jgi:hypothetical protein